MKYRIRKNGDGTKTLQRKHLGSWENLETADDISDFRFLGKRLRQRLENAFESFEKSMDATENLSNSINAVSSIGLEQSDGG